MQEKLNGIQLVSLVGRQGAGKSTLGKILAKKLDCPHIETSDVVKKVFPSFAVDELPRTSGVTSQDPTWLGDAIMQKIVKEYPTDVKVVLTGVRELDVHRTLIINYKARLSGVVIYCPAADRLDRQLSAGKCLTAQEFMTRDQRESDMGMDALFPLYPSVLCANSTKPTRVVDQIIELLENVGAF